jgi:hypothetical protein
MLGGSYLGDGWLGSTLYAESEEGFTLVTLTGTFQTGGEPATGTLTFTLTQPMQDGDSILPASPVTVSLDENGRFSVVLAANDDPATVPQGVQYGVTEQVVGAQPRDYLSRR